MGWIRIGPASALEPGWVIEAQRGRRAFAICNLDGEICALEGSCPCAGGPLGAGALREGLLVCPWHGWRFDPRTGAMAYDDQVRIRTYPVEIRRGQIFVKV